MGFINPIWLAGLTALIVPIAIHLLSRKENQRIQLGSLRHLQDSSTNKSMSLRLNEWLLLAVRSLLISLIVMLLSGLFLQSYTDRSQRWLVIEPGLEGDESVRQVIDSLTSKGFEQHQFALGFPPVGEPVKDSTSGYWRLVTDLEKMTLDEIVLITYNRADRFYGKRRSRPDNLTTILREPDSTTLTLWAVKRGDSIISRNGMYGPVVTSFQNTTETSSKENTMDADTIRIGIIADPKHGYEKKIVQAALQAIESPVMQYDVQAFPGEMNAGTKNLDWLILLQDKPASDTKTTNKITMGVGRPASSPLLIESDCQNGNGSCWTFSKRLTVDLALREHLSVQLSQILSESQRAKWNGIAAASDRRVLPEEVAWSRVQPAASALAIIAPAQSGIEVPLAICILLVLALERFIAVKRNQ